MYKFLILMYKDLILILKDIPGAVLMFLMPLILVLIMTSVQDATFRSIHEEELEIVLLNNDNDSLGDILEKKIDETSVFRVVKTINGKTPTGTDIQNAVARGDFMLGLIIPEHTTASIRKRIKKEVVGAFTGSTVKSGNDSLEIQIFFDPVTTYAYKKTLTSTLREFTFRIEKELTIEEFSKEVNKRIPMKNIEMKATDPVKIIETYATSGNSSIIPTSTQHNASAWTLFAMFFTVVSLAGNMIREREEGSFNRLLIMPTSFLSIINSKIVVYLFICISQVVLIFLMGIYLLPLLGLPEFVLNTNPIATFLIIITSSLAAITYGTLLGTLTSTYQQATTFGSVSVIILSAIGGIWVPVFAMPDFMKTISILSPLNWGIEGFYEVFVRDGSVASVAPYALELLVFALVCYVFTQLYFRRMIRR